MGRWLSQVEQRTLNPPVTGSNPVRPVVRKGKRGAAGFTKAELGLVATGAFLVFSRVFGLGVVLPNFRAHYAGAFDTDAFWIGVAFTAQGLTLALAQLPVGTLSDRFGRRPLLVAAGVVFVAGSLVCAFADSIGLLIVGRLVQGAGAVGSVALAAVGETIPPRRRTMAMAMVGIPAGAGFLVGIAVGPALYPLFSMQGLFVLSAVVGVASTVPVFFVRVAAPQERPPPAPAAAGPLTGLAGAGFVTNFTLMTTLFFLPTTDWRVLTPMLLVALAAVAVTSRAIDRRQATWPPIAAALLVLGVLAAVFVSVDGALAFAAGVGFFAAHATLATAVPSQVSRIAGPRGGRGHGVQAIAQYGGTALAGPVAGGFAAASASGGAMLVAAVLAAGATALVYVGFRAGRTRAGVVGDGPKPS